MSRRASSDRTGLDLSGDCETWRVGLSGAVASLVFVVPHVTRLGTGRFWCAFGMICLCERGDAGLVPAVGLIRSLSARCRA
jgi:hypothetical protein